MKKTALSLACFSSILVFSTTSIHAAEKKTIFNTESMKYESGTGSERCRDKCGRRSGPDAKSLVSEGWKIISTASKEIIAEQYWYAGCNGCQPHGCICIGTEYVLQKDAPAPGIETKSNSFDVPDKANRTTVQPLEVETSKNKLDLLKKENESLKQENALLKKEIELLRNQLKSKKK